MNFWGDDFSAVTRIVAWLIMFVSLAFCARAVVRRPPGQSSRVVALLLTVMLWTLHVRMEGGAQNGMSYHLLCVTLDTLLLGLPAAVILTSGVACLYAVIFHGFGDLSAVGLNVLVTVIPVILWTQFTLFAARRYLPRNLFVFIFVNGFFTAASGMMLSGCLTLSLLDFADVHRSDVLWHNAFPVFFLLSWAEAFFTGLVTAVLISFKPEVVFQYSDQFYLPQEESLF